jgi:hypothetical protein
MDFFLLIKNINLGLTNFEYLKIDFEFERIKSFLTVANPSYF